MIDDVKHLTTTIFYVRWGNGRALGSSHDGANKSEVLTEARSQKNLAVRRAEDQNMIDSSPRISGILPSPVCTSYNNEEFEYPR